MARLLYELYLCSTTREPAEVSRGTAPDRSQSWKRQVGRVNGGQSEELYEEEREDSCDRENMRWRQKSTYVYLGI